MKHILFISSEPLGPIKMPLASVYVLDQIELIKPSFDKVGILAVAFLPTSKLLLAKRFYEFDNENINDVIYISAVRKKVIPIKFMSQKRQYKLLITYGMNKFKDYINIHGLPDLIHAHNSFFAGLLAVEIKKTYNIPFVLTEHSSVLYNELTIFEKKWLIKIYKYSDILAAVSIGLADKIIKNLGVNKGNNCIEIVPNALNPLFERHLNLDRLNKPYFRFITVGNLVDVKNQTLLLEAFAAYFNNDKDVKLIIIGEGPLKSKLISISCKLGIQDQVEFTGYIDKEKVREQLCCSDVFVLSSKHETYGIVVMEALSCGLPVISTPCHGPDMMINDDNGRIVSNHTIHELGRMMLNFKKGKYNWNHALIREDCIKKFGSKSFKNTILNLYKLLSNNIK